MLRVAPFARLTKLLPAVLLACTGPAQPADNNAAPPTSLGGIAQHFDQQWAQHKRWDDGLAEVATYEAERVIYKKPRRFEQVIITVKEDFNREFDVKTDDYQRPDLFGVMKVNQFSRIETDNYPYHLLTSLFFRRQEPLQLHKLTSSSQEWCGNTFKSFTDAGQQYRMSFNSYWDGQGIGERMVARDVVFEDALLYTLRSLRFRDGLRFTAKVLELQQSNKAPEPQVYQAEFSVRASPAATASPAAWQVRVALAPGKINTYTFAADSAHLLTALQSWDGRLLKLKKVSRYAYWQR